MKRAQEVTETPDAADAFDPLMSKEDKMRDSYKQQKSDSLRSLPAGLVRRPPPGRGGLTRVVAAAGLALILSACGGGGGAGALNSGAALGASAPSIQVDAVVAPALVEPTPPAEQATPVAPTPVAKAATPAAPKTTPDAKETPPPNPQAEAPRNPKTPPGADDKPPPTDLPPVDETIPPGIQEPPAPTDRYTVTDPSTIPFPSGSPVTDEKVNMNTFGIWGHPIYQPGGAKAHLNNGPNVRVRRRVGYETRVLTLPVSGGTGEFAYTSLYYGAAAIGDLWLTYPADAGADDLAVHIYNRRATKGGYGSVSDDAAKNPAVYAAIRITIGLGTEWPDILLPDPAWADSVRSANHGHRVQNWLEAAARLGPYYGFTVEDMDIFLTEAYLQAPGSAVQPAAQGSETSATWTGNVIAFDSAAKSYMFRGHEIGGDAEVTVNFGNSPTVDVSLTDLRSARVRVTWEREPNGGVSPSRYPNQTWTGLALSNGGFSDTSGRRSIKGVFRSQVQSTGTNANTVGGIFDVFGTMKGGFVATIAPPSPGQ